jgi:hypothetical protein
VNVSRRQTVVGAGVVAVLALAALLLWRAQQRADAEANTPGWTDPQQPADDVRGDLAAPDPGVSWAANRCGPMTACCTGQTAGRRTRRLYDDSLASSSASFVISLSGGC